MTNEALFALFESLFPDGRWPKPLHVLQGLRRVERGEPIEQVAQQVGTTARTLIGRGSSPDPIEDTLGIAIGSIDGEKKRRSTQILGQLLLGRCAEIVFEAIFKREMPATELSLRDVREGRTDTDYRLYNSGNRPVYRVNIKFHGSRFRRAPELVNLDPTDCFALATYKIYSALQKQEEERLPYFFAIVGVADLTGESVGNAMPSELLDAAALVDQAPKGPGKRDFEDAVVGFIIDRKLPVYTGTLAKIETADWYILSARRADQLLRSQLFERVFALRIRNFARAFRGAELDMHFSLSYDLCPLQRFLDTVKANGLHAVTTLLERGEY